MKKTYSQKVARIFEIIGYILLVPTIFSLIYPVFLLIGGLLGGSPEIFLYGLLPFIVVGVGVILLVGYFRHSRGKLDANHISALWTATAVYNFLLLLPWLIGAAFLLQSSENLARDGNWFAFLMTISVVSAYGSIIYFALKAYSFEKRKKLL